MRPLFVDITHQKTINVDDVSSFVHVDDEKNPSLTLEMKNGKEHIVDDEYFGLVVETLQQFNILVDIDGVKAKPRG